MFMKAPKMSENDGSGRTIARHLACARRAKPHLFGAEIQAFARATRAVDVASYSVQTRAAIITGTAIGISVSAGKARAATGISQSAAIVIFSNGLNPFVEPSIASSAIAGASAIRS